MKDLLIRALTMIFTALFLISAVMLGKMLLDRHANQQAFDEVAQLVEQPSDEETAQPLTAAEKYGALYQQNNDFIGWISIENTEVNYPVMQTPDDPQYYLRRGFDHQPTDYGVPFMQEDCRAASSDNCIIYGHHMKDGSMFADLCRYTDEEFYREHPVVQFDTLTAFGTYEIIAAFQTVDDDHGFAYYKFVDAPDEAAFDAFVQSCQALTPYDTGVDATYGDKLLTLSTCEYSQANGRMVIVAKRTKSSETEPK